MEAVLRIFAIWKNQRFRSKNGFESVFELSRAPFGCSWDSLGGSLGPPDLAEGGLQTSLGTFLALLFPRLATDDGFGNVASSFGTSRGRF